MFSGGTRITASNKARFLTCFILLFFLNGCVQSVPATIKHCFDSGNWINDNFVFQLNKTNWNFQCVEETAIKEHNPMLCAYLHASVDDACIQGYYEKIGDPTVCEQISGGMKENCTHYYYLTEKCKNNEKWDVNCAHTYIIAEKRPDFCGMLPNEDECLKLFDTQ